MSYDMIWIKFYGNILGWFHKREKPTMIMFDADVMDSFAQSFRINLMMKIRRTEFHEIEISKSKMKSSSLGSIGGNREMHFDFLYWC